MRHASPIVRVSSGGQTDETGTPRCFVEARMDMGDVACAVRDTVEDCFETDRHTLYLLYCASLDAAQRAAAHIDMLRDAESRLRSAIEMDEEQQWLCAVVPLELLGRTRTTFRLVSKAAMSQPFRLDDTPPFE